MFKLKVIEGKVGLGVKFIRIRRITGYLVGDIARFNEAKTAELHSRVIHSITGQRNEVKYLNFSNKNDGENL